MDRHDIEDVMRRMDRAASAKGLRPRLVVIGGAAFILHGATERRATLDIDVLVADGLGGSDLFGAFPEVNTACNAYCLNLPYNYEDRLVRLELGTRALEVLTPSLEDLAVTKLYRYGGADIQDIGNPLFLARVDRALLERLVSSPGEAAASRIAEPESDREFKQMLCNYESYKEDYLYA